VRSGWAIPTHTIPADFAALTPEDESSNAIRSQGVCPQALCSFQKKQPGWAFPDLSSPEGIEQNDMCSSGTKRGAPVILTNKLADLRGR
jgi:hypothetical protein